MVISTLRRRTTVTTPEEWAARSEALLARLRPFVERQPGFVSHELRREDERGSMAEVTAWRTADDCRAYLRNGAAAMAATMLDAFFPTAPYPNGAWVRETVEQA
ncbi:MAG: antibiotic biosynthesis monooxygenase family protein [Dehalococcoidia bacterium]